MPGPRYTASKSLPQGRQSYTVSFRHPLRTDSDGKRGLKVRRGLGTSDEREAERLVDQLNELLRNESYWSPSARGRAEERFDEIVVDAFYTGIEVPPSNPADLREEEIPLPGREEGYARVLFVGTTGAGKTTLLRHLIGSDPETDRFPSTATGRTTTADIEVITASGPYLGAVTFLGRSAVRSFVQECVENAVIAAWNEQSEEEIARRLLNHPDQTFRLNYTLGSWDSAEDADDDDGWGFEAESPTSTEVTGGGIPTPEEREEHAATLRDFVTRVCELSVAAADELADALDVEVEELEEQDPETVEPWIVEQVEDHPAHKELLDDLLAAILERFDFLQESRLVRDTTGWPVVWSCSSDDRKEFLEEVRWFSSNYAPRFGRLLTPLVQGIRVQGPFYPSPLGEIQPKLVLMDGQGLGHTADSAGSVTTHLTSRFDMADVILLVDSAQQPMQAASIAAVRAAAVGGHQNKLRIAFTHFDLVTGPNLGNPKAKQEHLISAARNAVTTLRNEIGEGLVRMIDRSLESRCFTFGWLDQKTQELPPKVKEQLRDLLTVFESSIEVERTISAQPVYDPASLLFAIQSATRDFHARWAALLGLSSTDGVRKEHWSRIKALNRRIAESMDVEYDTLRPVADLRSRLAEEISRFIEQPVRWEGDQAEDKRVRSEATDAIRRSVSRVLHDIALERLVNDHRSDWVEAYGHRGRGSTFVRAREIRDIYEEAAPIPEAVMNEPTQQFLKELRGRVEDAIEAGGAKLIREPSSTAGS